MEIKRPTKLAIDGKVIDISRIAEKSVAQFNAQLKQNGIVLTEERLQSVYNACGGGKTDEELAALAEEAKKNLTK